MKATLRSDRRKNPEFHNFRKLTTSDIINSKKNRFGYLQIGQLWASDKNGKMAQVRQSGKIKTWKRDPVRFEFPVKYGLYESWHVTDKTIDTIYIEL
jgi:hypothetical protein